jgi:hypothetical protein
MQSQGVTERCGKNFGTSPHTKTRKDVHMNMCPETFNINMTYSSKNTV